MVQLMDLQEGDEISDFICGLGLLLFKVGWLICDCIGLCKYVFYGQEVIGSIWVLVKMNMFLYGEDNYCIEWGDIICNFKLFEGEFYVDLFFLIWENLKFIFKQFLKLVSFKYFDIVVVNLLFLLEKWGYEGVESDFYSCFCCGVLLCIKGDYVFILYMVEIMKFKIGCMVVVVLYGVLFCGVVEGWLCK